MKLPKVLVLSGDGIGPKITDSAVRILKLFDSIEILQGQIGHSAYESTGNYLPHETMDLLDECNYILSGPVSVSGNVKNPLDTLKIQLDLFGRGRLYKTLASDLGVEDMDVTLWSSYNNINSEIVEVKDFDGVTISKYIRNDAYGRMMNIALKDIEHRRLKNVICLTREDFFPISSGMFIEAFDNIFTSDEFEIRKMNVKDWMSRIFKDPKHDDCIICVDLYNQIVAGILSGMTGNENLFPTVYRGDQYSLYEPNFYPDVPGFNSANPNPTSAIIATSAIMSNLGMDREADEIIDALCDCYANMQRTPDVGGSLTTEEFTDKIISHL